MSESTNTPLDTQAPPRVTSTGEKIPLDLPRRYCHARLGFFPAASLREPSHATGGEPLAYPGERAYRCGFTGALFALPAGSPVPCLRTEHLAENALGQWEPVEYVLDSDGPFPERPGGEKLWPLHPRLACRGAEAIRDAVHGASARAYTSGDSTEAEALRYLALDFDTVSTERLSARTLFAEAFAMDVRNADGSGYGSVPAGWHPLNDPS